MRYLHEPNACINTFRCLRLLIINNGARAGGCSQRQQCQAYQAGTSIHVARVPVITWPSPLLLPVMSRGEHRSSMVRHTAADTRQRMPSYNAAQSCSRGSWARARRVHDLLWLEHSMSTLPATHPTSSILPANDAYRSWLFCMPSLPAERETANSPADSGVSSKTNRVAMPGLPQAQGNKQHIAWLPGGEEIRFSSRMRAQQSKT